MREYTIVRKPADWEQVPVLPIDTLLWSPEVPISAEARICYDEDALYVQMQAVEPQIRAEDRDILGEPCNDSCLEFFFCPITGDTRYFNIEYNPNACMYLGFGDIGRLVRLVPDEAMFRPQVAFTDDGWRITYQIPISFIQHFFPAFRAESGASIRANCYKCGDLTVQPHYLSWNPMTSETPAFHRPNDFGLMHLE